MKYLLEAVLTIMGVSTHCGFAILNADWLWWTWPPSYGLNEMSSTQWNKVSLGLRLHAYLPLAILKSYSQTSLVLSFLSSELGHSDPSQVWLLRFHGSLAKGGTEELRWLRPSGSDPLDSGWCPGVWKTCSFYQKPSSPCGVFSSYVSLRLLTHHRQAVYFKRTSH